MEKKEIIEFVEENKLFPDKKYFNAILTIFFGENVDENIKQIKKIFFVHTDILLLLINNFKISSSTHLFDKRIYYLPENADKINFFSEYSKKILEYRNINDRNKNYIYANYYTLYLSLAHGVDIETLFGIIGKLNTSLDTIFMSKCKITIHTNNNLVLMKKYVDKYGPIISDSVNYFLCTPCYKVIEYVTENKVNDSDFEVCLNKIKSIEDLQAFNCYLQHKYGNVDYRNFFFCKNNMFGFYNSEFQCTSTFNIDLLKNIMTVVSPSECDTSFIFIKIISLCISGYYLHYSDKNRFTTNKFLDDILNIINAFDDLEINTLKIIKNYVDSLENPDARIPNIFHLLMSEGIDEHDIIKMIKGYTPRRLKKKLELDNNSLIFLYCYESELYLLNYKYYDKNEDDEDEDEDEDGDGDGDDEDEDDEDGDDGDDDNDDGEDDGIYKRLMEIFEEDMVDIFLIKKYGALLHYIISKKNDTRTYCYNMLICDKIYDMLVDDYELLIKIVNEVEINGSVVNHGINNKVSIDVDNVLEYMYYNWDKKSNKIFLKYIIINMIKYHGQENYSEYVKKLLTNGIRFDIDFYDITIESDNDIQIFDLVYEYYGENGLKYIDYSNLRTPCLNILTKLAKHSISPKINNLFIRINDRCEIDLIFELIDTKIIISKIKNIYPRKDLLNVINTITNEYIINQKNCNENISAIIFAIFESAMSNIIDSLNSSIRKTCESYSVKYLQTVETIINNGFDKKYIYEYFNKKNIVQNKLCLHLINRGLSVIDILRFLFNIKFENKSNDF